MDISTATKTSRPAPKQDEGEKQISDPNTKDENKIIQFVVSLA